MADVPGSQVHTVVELRATGEDNYKECLRLKVSLDNENFADPVVYSLAEAWVFYNETKAFAIYNNNDMIGFVSMYIGEENPQIINFLIDDAYQGNGFGTEAAKICINYLRKEYNAKRISVPVETRHFAAQRFWEKLGFGFSDCVEDGYVFMRLHLL